jgi:anionic cell wall polymer biosynthesis LytR-Cps2A-Psr (LCP) family protein
MTLAVVGILAACMWLVCSLIYMWAFFYESQNSNYQDSGKEEEVQYDVEREESIQAKLQSRSSENKNDLTTKNSLEDSEDNPTREGLEEIDV